MIFVAATTDLFGLDKPTRFKATALTVHIGAIVNTNSRIGGE